MQAGDISVDENLTRYHDEYRRSFRESDSGRRFEDAFQVIITDEGRQQIDEALRAIAKGAHRQSAGQNAPRFACPPPAPAPDLRTGPGGRLAGARLRPSAGRENRRISRGN